MRVWLLLLLGACAFTARGKPPPDDDLYFVTGVVVPSGSHYAYIVSSNFDLRYNAGTVSVADLNTLRLGDPDNDFNTESITRAWTQHIGNIGSRPTLNSAHDRLFVATRERALLFNFDIDVDGALSCGDRSKPFEQQMTCDNDHVTRISGTQFASNLTLADTADPYVAVVTPPFPGASNELMFLTHLSAGAVTAWDVSKNSVDNPLALRPMALLGADLFGIAVNGTAAIAVASAPGRKSIVYAGSGGTATTTRRLSSTLFYFEPRVSTGEPGVLGALQLQALLGGSIASIDVKDIAVRPDGERIYMLTREPDAIVELDTSLDIDGRPRHTLVATAPLDRQPGQIVYVDGPHPLLYVTCYQDNTIRAYDAATLTPAGKTFYLTKGPYAITVARLDGGRVWLLASYFNDDGVVVLDMSDPDPTNHSIIARIGKPRSMKQ